MLPVAVALFIVNMGRPASIVSPPTGALALGADRAGPTVGAGAAARWVIEMAVPAMVSVAMRSAPELTATLNWTVPLPVPLAPWEMVTKRPLLVAVHAPPAAAVTATVPVPPSGPYVAADG